MSKKGSLPGVVANVLNYDIVISELELQSHYSIHFRTNTRGKHWEPPYPIQLWVK